MLEDITLNSITSRSKEGNEIEETSQGPLEPKQKTPENTDKFSQYLETSSALDQTDLLDISVGTILKAEISTPNKLIIETKNPESIL